MFSLWNYSVENDYPNIVLHDCRIVKVLIENKDLIFEFDDNGFWLTENNKLNSFRKTLRTDRAQVRFKNIDQDFTHIYVFKNICLFKKSIFTIRKEISLEDFCSKINCGIWQFEIVDELYAYRNVVFNGGMFFNKKPYHRECQVQIFFETMTYLWNKICEDKAW